MDDALRISVVVVSRARPEMLVRCLASLEQQIWPLFEIIAVVDKPGRDAIEGQPHIRVVACDQANISLARNLGIAAAGGDVIAFIDDDAVAEPMWLAALATAFEDGAVGAATGPVLGRNGISLQSGAETILTTSETVPSQADPSRRRAHGIRAPKTVGTNMAFRTDLLRSVGGFDECYRYYLEDSDLNIRLGRMGVVTAYEAAATVHHNRAPSKRRRSDRAPRDLFDIGRSSAIFIDRHCGQDAQKALEAVRAREWKRLDGLLLSGKIEPRQARALLKSFDEGAAKALPKDAQPRLHEFGTSSDFEPWPVEERRNVAIASGLRQKNKAYDTALSERKQGAIVSLMILSPTSLYHRVSFENGIWVQRGGTFGRSDRGGPIVQLTTRKKRYESEFARVSAMRGWERASDMQIPHCSGESALRLSFF